MTAVLPEAEFHDTRARMDPGTRDFQGSHLDFAPAEHFVLETKDPYALRTQAGTQAGPSTRA